MRCSVREEIAQYSTCRVSNQHVLEHRGRAERQRTGVMLIIILLKRKVEMNTKAIEKLMVGKDTGVDSHE